MAKTTIWHADLKHALDTRRQVRNDVQERIRNGRSDRTSTVRDTADASDANFQQAIDVTLLQMRATMLSDIDDALGRMNAGRYGFCVGCADRIPQERLRALPFAVRCRDCEEQREQELGRARQVALRSASPFSRVA